MGGQEFGVCGVFYRGFCHPYIVVGRYICLVSAVRDWKCECVVIDEMTLDSCDTTQLRNVRAFGWFPFILPVANGDAHRSQIYNTHIKPFIHPQRKRERERNSHRYHRNNRALLSHLFINHYSYHIVYIMVVVELGGLAEYMRASARAYRKMVLSHASACSVRSVSLSVFIFVLQRVLLAHDYYTCNYILCVYMFQTSHDMYIQ